MLSVRYFYFVYQPAGLTPFGRHVGCEYTPGGLHLQRGWIGLVRFAYVHCGSLFHD